MKSLQATLLMILLVWVIGCQKREHDGHTRMMLDAEASGKNVTVVKEKQPMRPEETVSDLREQKNIMQYDLEAKEQTPSKEVVYVKPGEPVRPAEQRK